ncbi:MAG: Spx/MgsR family RNA polymerase-binding regulatory protein [Cyanobacteria bacterium]|nr:Spx/MgsR family RNA polymerase-binding regulatory protein [Cyanobacteriota bacterium]
MAIAGDHLPLKVYAYGRCSTCRKALTWLAQQGLSAGPGLELIEITTSPPSRGALAEALAALGAIKCLFNTSGQSYRALGAAAVAAMGQDEALQALAADGKLIKRPLVFTAQGKVLVGFKPEEWRAVLLG